MSQVCLGNEGWIGQVKSGCQCGSRILRKSAGDLKSYTHTHKSILVGIASANSTKTLGSFDAYTLVLCLLHLTPNVGTEKVVCNTVTLYSADEALLA